MAPFSMGSAVRDDPRRYRCLRDAPYTATGADPTFTDVKCKIPLISLKVPLVYGKVPLVYGKVPLIFGKKETLIFGKETLNFRKK